MKKTIIKSLLKPISDYRKKKENIWCEEHPKEYADRIYKKKFGRHINWDNPTEFNEKIRWMQFYTDTEIWSQLADKYRVRKYLEKRGYGDILVKLYGVWNNSEEIDFDSLPNSFVLKTNHGSGEVIVVKDKRSVDVSLIREKMDYFLHTPFGFQTAEPHYLHIKPVILAEEMIENDSSWSTSLVDYKFYCFNGEPFCCTVFFNRDIEKHQRFAEIYDMGWNRHDEWLRDTYRPDVAIDVPRPQCLVQLLETCRKLAADFPFVRMDFYVKGEKFYFGEFTFTPAACSVSAFNNEACSNVLGPLLKINLSK